MSLVNQMLRDLDDQDHQQSRSRKAWTSKVRATTSPAYDSRFLIVAGVLGLFLLGGAATLWSAKGDSEQLRNAVPGLKPAREIVELPLDLSQSVGQQPFQTDRKIAVAATGDAPEHTTTHSSEESAPEAPEQLSTTANTVQPAADKQPSSAENKRQEEPCCQGEDCSKLSGQATSFDCPPGSLDSKGASKNKAEAVGTATAVQRIPRPLNKNQKSQKFYREGHAHAAQNRIDLAASKLESALQFNPDNVPARLLLAEVYLKREGDSVAAGLLDRGLERQPGNAPLTKLRAKLYVQQNNTEMAVQTLMQGLANAGTDSEFYAFLAALYQGRQNHKHAIKLYRRALSITPDTAKSWLGLAISLEANDRFQESLHAYRLALRDNNLPPTALNYIHQRIAVLTVHEPLVNAPLSHRQ